MSEEPEKPLVESAKSSKQQSNKEQLTELISIMKADMEKIQGIGQGLTVRCSDMLLLLKELTDPSVPAPPKDPYPNYVT
jgi:hypothetical protein